MNPSQNAESSASSSTVPSLAIKSAADCARHAARELAPADLARWMIEDRLDVRLQVQLHRVLWPGVDRGV